MFSYNVQAKLQTLHCYQTNESGSAEPYMFTVFFKVDGDTAFLDARKSVYLQGSATIVDSPGEQGDLGVSGVSAGGDIPIPPSVGEWSTVLKPIPITDLNGGTKEAPPIVGFVIVLMEEDASSAALTRRVHGLVNSAVQEAFDTVLPTLSIGHPLPTRQELQDLLANLQHEITEKAKDSGDVGDILAAGGDFDDFIGFKLVYYTYDKIAKFGEAGMGFHFVWEREGEWAVTGEVTAQPIIHWAPPAAPTSLVPFTGAASDVWRNRWQATPPNGSEPGITVVITADSDSRLNVDAQEAVPHPGLHSSIKNVAPAPGLEGPYAADVWAAEPIDMRPILSAVLRHAKTLRGKLISARSPEASDPTPGWAFQMHRIRPPQTSDSHDSEIAHPQHPIRFADQIQVTPTITLSLYAEESPSKAIQDYRVRYLRTSDAGDTIDDVMLEPHPFIG